MARVNRRLRRTAALVTAVALAVAVMVPATAADAGPASIAVQVSSTEIGRTMPKGFLGFSFEYQALRPYAGRDPHHVDPVLLGLIRGLAPDGAPVLRIGGNSTDQTWWPLRGMAPPGGVTFSLSRQWVRLAHALAADLRGRLILGVNLAADSPALAAPEGRALVGGVGRRYIAALEIGNEADVYNQFAWYRDRNGHVVFSRPSSYSLQGYIADFNRWRSAVPSVPLAGPAFAESLWMGDLSSFLSAEPKLSLVTFHRYPTRGCVGNPTSGIYASIPNILSDGSAAGLAQQVSPFVTAAHTDHVPFRLDELNSASCSGRRGVSDTFASALWSLDTLFNMASVGVDGINIHTLPGAAYQPFTVSLRRSRWTGSVKPLYYGLLMFARAFPAGARLLSVSAPSGPVKAWATQAPDGHVRVVLINKDPVTDVIVHVALPGAQTPATESALRAPALAATTGVTLDGETFGAATHTGVLPVNPHPTTLAPASGYYTVTLPAGSALMLTR
jgi:hypothetical protein